MEKYMTKKESQLVKAISWIDRIKHKNIKSIVERHASRLKLESTSNLSSFIGEGDKKEMPVDRMIQYIDHKMKKQEIWIVKLIRDKEEGIKKFIDAQSKMESMQQYIK